MVFLRVTVLDRFYIICFLNLNQNTLLEYHLSPDWFVVSLYDPVGSSYARHISMDESSKTRKKTSRYSNKHG